MISFTGSTAVGQHIARVAAPMMKKLSLELGGKNAAVVFADANLDQCLEVRGTLKSFCTLCSFAWKASLKSLLNF
jgi:acyl-CoA reductase-like NAD-dependent aldehyde dehydrogenase